MAVATPNYVFVAREVNTYVTVCLLQERSTPNCACVCYKRGQHPCICAQLQEKSTPNTVCLLQERSIEYPTVCLLQHPTVCLLQERSTCTQLCVCSCTKEVNIQMCICYKRGQHPIVCLLQERLTSNCVPVTREVNT